MVPNAGTQTFDVLPASGRHSRVRGNPVSSGSVVFSRRLVETPPQFSHMQPKFAADERFKLYGRL